MGRSGLPPFHASILFAFFGSLPVFDNSIRQRRKPQRQATPFPQSTPPPSGRFSTSYHRFPKEGSIIGGKALPSRGPQSCDKAMGTAALSDARSVLSIAISHNMDNVAAISQDDLNRYMGLTYVSGTTGPARDQSGSKTMEVDQNNNTITYTYTCGGVALTGTINVATQSVTWQVSGIGQNADQTNDPNNTRYRAFCEGLKVQNGDLTCA